MFIVEWWNSLGLAGQIFACVAIPSTLVLLIQTVMMFLGLGDDADADGIGEGADFIGEGTDIPDDLPDDIPDSTPEGIFGDGDADFDDIDASGLDSLRIFTFRGIIAFLVVFGWVGVAMAGGGAALYITIPVSTLCGASMMLFIALMMRGVMRLRSDGNTDNRNAIGTAGVVQLTIPAARAGMGKVHLMLQGSYVERDAVTDEDSPLPTGSEIVVIGVSGQTTLVVRKK